MKHLLSMLRDKETDTVQFRHYSDRIMRLLVEEAISQECERAGPKKKHSPTGNTYDHYALDFDNNDFCAVTIMRGGDSMLSEVFNLIPGVGIGKVLIQRDESTADKRPVFYYANFPTDIATKRRVLVLDPMCATGGTAVMCIQKLIESGVPEENITFINLVCAEEGVDKVLKAFPKV